MYSLYIVSRNSDLEVNLAPNPFHTAILVFSLIVFSAEHNIVWLLRERIMRTVPLKHSMEIYIVCRVSLWRQLDMQHLYQSHLLANHVPNNRRDREEETTRFS